MCLNLDEIVISDLSENMVLDLLSSIRSLSKSNRAAIILNFKDYVDAAGIRVFTITNGCSYYTPQRLGDLSGVKFKINNTKNIADNTPFVRTDMCYSDVASCGEDCHKFLPFVDAPAETSDDIQKLCSISDGLNSLKQCLLFMTILYYKIYDHETINSVAVKLMNKKVFNMDSNTDALSNRIASRALDNIITLLHINQHADDIPEFMTYYNILKRSFGDIPSIQRAIEYTKNQNQWSRELSSIFSKYQNFSHCEPVSNVDMEYINGTPQKFKNQSSLNNILLQQTGCHPIDFSIRAMINRYIDDPKTISLKIEESALAKLLASNQVSNVFRYIHKYDDGFIILAKYRGKPFALFVKNGDDNTIYGIEIGESDKRELIKIHLTDQNYEYSDEDIIE